MLSILKTVTGKKQIYFKNEPTERFVKNEKTATDFL